MNIIDNIENIQPLEVALPLPLPVHISLSGVRLKQTHVLWNN